MTTTRYHVEKEYLCGPVSAQAWSWVPAEGRDGFNTPGEAFSRMADLQAHALPNKHVRGYRVVRIVTTTTAEVVQP